MAHCCVVKKDSNKYSDENDETVKAGEFNKQGFHLGSFEGRERIHKRYVLVKHESIYR